MQQISTLKIQKEIVMLRTPSRLEPAFRIKKKLNSIDSTKLHNPNELKQQRKVVAAQKIKQIETAFEKKIA